MYLGLWHTNMGTYCALGAVVALAIVASVYAYVHTTGGSVDTITIHPKEFFQQIGISGKVTPAHEVDLGFAGSGRIAHVYAAVGGTVAAGTLLAEIENGDLRAGVSQKLSALASQQAKLDALKAGTRPESLAISQAAVVSAQSALTQSHQALVDAIRSAYAVADDAVRNKTDQLISNPRSASPQLVFAVSDSQIAIAVLDERISMEKLLLAWHASAAMLAPEDDTHAPVRDARAALAAAVRLLSDANAALNTAIPTNGVTTASINGLIASIATGRTALTGALSALSTAQAGEESSQAALTSAQKNLALAQAGATAEDIAGQAAQVAAAAADVENARAQLGKTLIVAPFSGVITRMDAKTGSIVSPNISEISLESRGTFQVEGYVPEINVALVQPGQEAAVTLDAYGSSMVFDAVVVSVDPAETVRDAVSTYRVVLQFATPDDRIKSGMTANVTITAQRRKGVIAVPQGIVTTKEGRSFVQITDGKNITERPVTTGAVSSLGEIEILSGLSDGDTVVMPLLDNVDTARY